jgi:hypothetical protein
MAEHQPLTAWHCDVCGELVHKDEENWKREGYVYWDDDRKIGPVLIHKTTCLTREIDELESSSELADFLGPDGLVKLTAFLSWGLVRSTHAGRSPTGCQLELDPDKFVDFFRRVQLPYYEEARARLQDRARWEDLADASEVFPYTHDYLQRVLAEQ